MVELFTWSRTDGYSIVKPEIKNKVEIPEMLPHKCATEVLAETEKFVEPIDNYSAGKGFWRASRKEHRLFISSLQRQR